MKKITYFIMGFFALTLMFSACKNQTENTETTERKEIPLEDFFKNPEKNGYSISPDGKYFSYKAPVEGRMNIFVQEIGKEEVKQLTFEKDRDIAGYF